MAVALHIKSIQTHGIRCVRILSSTDLYAQSVRVFETKATCCPAMGRPDSPLR